MAQKAACSYPLSSVAWRQSYSLSHLYVTYQLILFIHLLTPSLSHSLPTCCVFDIQLVIASDLHLDTCTWTHADVACTSKLLFGISVLLIPKLCLNALSASGEEPLPWAWSVFVDEFSDVKCCVTFTYASISVCNCSSHTEGLCKFVYGLKLCVPVPCDCSGQLVIADLINFLSFEQVLPAMRVEHLSRKSFCISLFWLLM